eukprot:12414302-Karenia_brevis.AAC.1
MQMKAWHLQHGIQHNGLQHNVDACMCSHVSGVQGYQYMQMSSSSLVVMRAAASVPFWIAHFAQVLILFV